MQVYFYPHSYLRDRHLDTIRNWPADEAANREIAANRIGAQVSKAEAESNRASLNWRQRLPLLNVKLRPRDVPRDAVVYVWGGLMASGPFIIDLDNPWALVGYNIRALRLYRPIIRALLLSSRCRDIRCLSKACREGLRLTLGEAVYRKATVHYPSIDVVPPGAIQLRDDGERRFLFVGTQFELKGGAAMLRAFLRVHQAHGNCRLDVVSHLPDQYRSVATRANGVYVHEAHFSRAEIHARFMRSADVLVFPTYGESFGMVALEALAHGMAIVATDVYALRELVRTGVNGDLLEPPISTWDGLLPSHHQYAYSQYKQRIQALDTSDFENRLTEAMTRYIVDPAWLRRARNASLDLFHREYSGR